MHRERLIAILQIAALPLVVFAAEVYLRAVAGESWIWRHMDPDYFYLFDGLNLLNGQPLTHIWHPGIPVSSLNALILKALYPLTSGMEIASAVIAEPEAHLRILGTVYSALIAAAMVVAGWSTRRATDSPALALLVQSGPLFALLALKYGIRVKPEALLVIVTLLMSATVMTAVKDEVLAQNRLRLAVMFGVVAGLGAASKIVSAAFLGLIPIFLLGSWRAVLVFWASAGVATVLFCLPAASEFGRIAQWVLSLAKGSGTYGGEAKVAVGAGEYLRQFQRMLSQPAVSAPLVLAVVALGWGAKRRWANLTLRWTEWRALAGLTLATLAHAAVVAKQPSGHYMIPAYTMGALSVALSLRLIGDPAWWPAARQRFIKRATVGVVALVLASQVALLVRADKDFKAFRADNLAFGADAFPGCAQVFFYTASHPDFALLMAHYQTGYGYGELVKANISARSYYLRDWFGHETPELRTVDGPVSLKTILAENPCTVLRGGQGERFEKILQTQGLPDLKFDATCPSKYETAHVVGGECPSQ